MQHKDFINMSFIPEGGKMADLAAYAPWLTCHIAASADVMHSHQSEASKLDER